MPIDSIGYYDMLDIKKWNQEYLNFDSVLIDGKMPIITA
jgi:hypothetical protein